MRVLIVDTYYPALLAAHYERRPDLARRPYGEQLEALIELCFGTSDAYSRYLRELGHDAADVIVNCDPLQASWAEEHGMAGGLRRVASLAPGRAGAAARHWLRHRIALAQIAEYSPDVVYLQDLGFFSRTELDRLRAAKRFVVGQIASEPPPAETLRGFDLITTSFPHLVDRFRALGVDSEYFPIAFYEPALDRLRGEGIDPDAGSERPHALSFVGGLDPRVHPGGVALLERLCERLPVEVWGYGVDELPGDSPIRERYRGEAWGLEMYRVLARSRIVVNRHIEAAEEYANNMRLYETTGVGAMLLTESKRNLSTLFDPGREVVAYDSLDDLVAKAERMLGDERTRREVATAGQARTLREHTYRRRIAELARMLEARL